MNGQKNGRSLPGRDHILSRALIASLVRSGQFREYQIANVINSNPANETGTFNKRKSFLIKIMKTTTLIKTTINHNLTNDFHFYKQVSHLPTKFMQIF